MAGRQLQRLLKEQLPAAENVEESDHEEESSEDEEPTKPAFNPFDLLTDEEDDDVSSCSFSLFQKFLKGNVCSHSDVNFFPPVFFRLARKQKAL